MSAALSLRVTLPPMWKARELGLLNLPSKLCSKALLKNTTRTCRELFTLQIDMVRRPSRTDPIRTSNLESTAVKSYSLVLLLVANTIPPIKGGTKRLFLLETACQYLVRVGRWLQGHQDPQRLPNVLRSRPWTKARRTKDGRRRRRLYALLGRARQ